MQVAGALGGIEFYERGTPGHEAYLAYARGVLAPVLERIGWTPKGDETPDLRRLRRVLFTNLGEWGDPAVIAEARRRFAAFLADHKSLPPDEQSATLAVVAHHADAATFAQLQALAEGTHDTTEIERFYAALAKVQDPQLAQRVIDIALGGKLPPQANSLPMTLVFGLSGRNPSLAWKAFTEHNDVVLASEPMFASMIIAQYSPQIFWSGVSLADIEKFARAKVPENMAPLVDRGLATARVELKRKDTLVREADAWLAR
jgi:aminopeptidase N